MGRPVDFLDLGVFDAVKDWMIDSKTGISTSVSDLECL